LIVSLDTCFIDFDSPDAPKTVPKAVDHQEYFYTLKTSIRDENI
jgi:hypothetical protein